MAGILTQKRASNVVSALSMAIRNWWKSLGAMILAPAARAEAFKRCCLQSKRFDDSLRKDYHR
jgi:hypothetical protein